MAKQAEDLLAPLRPLVEGREDWLIERVLGYAKEHGYAMYSSTLVEAWRASIRGLSQALVHALEVHARPPVLNAGLDFHRDSVARFGVEEARAHRARGIPITLFLGLLKYYRQSYQDLVEEAGLPLATERVCRRFIDRVFDRVELGLCSEWDGLAETEKIREIQEHNVAITREKLKYLTIFESLRDPVIFLDPSGRIENMNNAACSVFDVGSEPGVLYYGHGLIGPVAERMGELLREAGNDSDVECTLDTRRGPRRFDAKLRPMLDISERFLGTVVILTDVTDYQRAREQAERANRAKSAFLATMSHEIRTPLNGILGMAQLLQATEPSARQRSCIDAISTSGEALLAILNDVLDYSKIEAGRLELEAIDFRLDELLETMRSLTQHQAARKGIVLRVERAPRVPQRLRGDPAKLSQVLLNLIGNAIKFTERGEVGLRVSTQAGAPPGRVRLRFAVTDTGIGIPPDARARLFEAFAQSDTSISRRYGGTGLGLAICKRIVDAIGGRIGVDSAPGEGSTFWVVVDLDRAARAVPTPVQDVADETRMPPLSVLAAEDNEVNAVVLTGLLELDGHRVTLAADGLTAVDLAAAHDFDLVLMDLRMPGLDGLEAARRIRALDDPRRAAVPIVAITANSQRAKLDACFAAGMDGFLGKPFRREDLRKALRDVLAERQPGSAAALDPAVLAEHAALLGCERLARIVDAFRTSSAALLADLRAAAAAGAWATAAERAHALKSASGNVGLTAFAALAKRAERATDAASAAALDAAYPGALAALDAEYRRVCAQATASTNT
ncbi:ATP-binding protein [Azospirillum sp.]|uniref:ATP-binding protein n=1 Tax=Azospirillum sp. TaxID=34012 RepID=UPI003D75C8FD